MRNFSSFLKLFWSLFFILSGMFCIWGSDFKMIDNFYKVKQNYKNKSSKNPAQDKTDSEKKKEKNQSVKKEKEDNRKPEIIRVKEDLNVEVPELKEKAYVVQVDLSFLVLLHPDFADYSFEEDCFPVELVESEIKQYNKILTNFDENISNLEKKILELSQKKDQWLQSKTRGDVAILTEIIQNQSQLTKEKNALLFKKKVAESSYKDQKNSWNRKKIREIIMDVKSVIAQIVEKNQIGVVLNRNFNVKNYYKMIDILDQNLSNTSSDVYKYPNLNLRNLIQRIQNKKIDDSEMIMTLFKGILRMKDAEFREFFSKDCSRILSDHPDITEETFEFMMLQKGFNTEIIKHILPVYQQYLGE